MTTFPMVAPICFQVAINGDPTKPWVYSDAFPDGKNRAIIPMHGPIVGSSFMTTLPLTAPLRFPGRHKWRLYKITHPTDESRSQIHVRRC